jgi:polyribonucleotide nucleotidyltransferase
MDYRASQVEETVNVPVERIPAIIGKGGSQIKEIQGTSGAQVNIDKESNVVTLKGTAFEVQVARDLIEAVVNPPEPQYEATTQMDLSLHPMGQRAVHVIKGACVLRYYIPTCGTHCKLFTSAVFFAGFSIAFVTSGC